MIENKIKEDFPILNRTFGKNKIVYLDSAATYQKPRQVIGAISNYYENYNSNVHRGIYTLSEEATNLYKTAREKVATFIGATNSSEIIFTKGVTESLNRIAFSFLAQYVTKGDEIIVVEADHHSNIVPWQIVAEKTGAKLVVLPVDANGEIDLKIVKRLLSDKVKFIALSHTSNVLGTIFPVKEICKLARKMGILVSVDGAQAVPHLQVDVSSLGCDFYSFSGHKMLGPMGIGVLWAKKELLEKMLPYEYGGGMIKTVDFKESTWDDIPSRFEAGTPNVEGAVGLAAAISYLEEIGMANIQAHEEELTAYALTELAKISKLSILGPLDAKKRCGLVSFVIAGIHSHDIASVLSDLGICVRSGQHCTMPLHVKLCISSSTRASFYIYNDKKDVNLLIDGIKKAKEILG
ncbi:cysteine desulfurase [candidate division WWE3 bacterium]|nr:cysteine desulfurase [candidate division WWE3 bacterium]